MTVAIKAVVKLARASGAVDDATRNTFYFQPPDNTSTSTALITTAITTFYDTLPVGGTHAIAGYFNSKITRSQTVHTITYYDITGKLGGQAAGPPLRTDSFQLTTTAAGATDLPDHDCIVASYHAQLLGLAEFGPLTPGVPTAEAAVDVGAPATHTAKTRPRSTQRGRIYLGPLNSLAISPNAVDGHMVVNPVATADVSSSMNRLMTTATIDWSQKSTVGSKIQTVTGGWTADLIGTRRKRRVEERLKVFFGSQA